MRIWRVTDVAWSVLIGILIGGMASYLSAIVIVNIGAESALERAVSHVEAVATDRGGVIRSVHRNDGRSYSIAAVVKDDQLPRLRTLLDEQSDRVTWDYVYATSKEHDDYLRVGIDLSMTPDQYSAAKWRTMSSPVVLGMLFVLFAVISSFIFYICIRTYNESKPTPHSQSRSY